MLPKDPKARKAAPICTGVLDYFPLALAAVAHCSKVANEQHNPGQPMHWDRSKSPDHADCILRHLAERGTVDTDGVLHSAKVAWRALALLQLEMERAGALTFASTAEPGPVVSLEPDPPLPSGPPIQDEPE